MGLFLTLNALFLLILFQNTLSFIFYDMQP